MISYIMMRVGFLIKGTLIHLDFMTVFTNIIDQLRVKFYINILLDVLKKPILFLWRFDQ